MATPLPKKRTRLNQEDRQQLLEKIRRLEDETAGQKQRIDELEQTIVDLQQQKDKKEEDQGNHHKNKGLYDIIEFPSKVPLRPDNLVPHLQELFQELVTQAKEVQSWDEAVGWFRKVERALKEYPILAQVASFSGDKRYEFLLGIALFIFGRYFDENRTTFPMPIFDLLMACNPYALAWNKTIFMIVNGFFIAEYTLFLTIASKYSWILELPEVSSQQPVQCFLEQALWADGDTDSVIKFYKSQPKLAKIQNKRTGRYPLHEHIMDLDFIPTEPDDLVEFLVEIFPEALLKQDNEGDTPLHCAFKSLDRATSPEDANHETKRNSIVAGKILLKENPSALLLKNKEGFTPLECLQLRPYQDESVRAFAVDVLRIYFPRPLSRSMKKIPFLQAAYAVLKEEAAFANNCVRIKRVATMVRNYCNAPTDPSNSDSDARAEINQIYSEWATRNLAAASIKIQSSRETDIPRMVRRRRSSGQDHH